MLHVMASKVSEPESESKLTAMVKLLELVLCLAYIIYDVAITEPPGTGTRVLIGFSCLSEVLLLCFEGFTVLAYSMGSAKVSPG